MLLRLIYAVAILVTFVICKMVYKENPTTTIKEIHHYYIYDTKENYDRKKAARKLMKEILYGYEYKHTISKEFNKWWEDPPGNHFNIFPGEVINEYR